MRGLWYIIINRGRKPDEPVRAAVSGSRLRLLGPVLPDDPVCTQSKWPTEPVLR